MNDTRVSEAIKIRNALATFEKNEGWQVLKALMAEKVANQLKEILGPLASVEQCTLQEYAKGRIRGLSEAMNLPEELLGNATDTIETFKDTEEEEAA